MKPDGALSIGIACLSALCACQPTLRTPCPAASDAESATTHAVQSEELRRIMNRLDDLQLTTWPQELQAEYASTEEYVAAKSFWEARRLAKGLARAAATIPQTVQHVSMSEADRRSFLAQVETLHEQAIRLERSAALGDRANMRRVLETIDETCLSCHERFRDITGPISPR